MIPWYHEDISGLVKSIQLSTSPIINKLGVVAMNSATIKHLQLRKQEAKEGILINTGYAFTKLVHSLIREHGVYKDNTIYVDSKSFPQWDKNLLLRHLIPASQYAEIGNQMTAHALFLEVLPHLESVFEQEIATVYQEDMEEMGMCAIQHVSNGETYWVRR